MAWIYGSFFKCLTQIFLSYKTLALRSFVVVHGGKKVKWSHYRPVVAQRVGRGIALLFHDRGTRRGWVVSSTPRPHFTPRKDTVPILHEVGWAPGRSWRAENLVPQGIWSQTIQPVVSRYTVWATRPKVDGGTYVNIDTICQNGMNSQVLSQPFNFHQQ